MKTPPPFDDRIMGIVLVLIGAILFSTKAVFVKLAYQYEVATLSLLSLRMGFAFPFFLLMGIFYTKEPLPQLVKAKTWLQLLLVALSGYYLASFFDFTGLQYIPAGVERLILFTYPTMVVLLSWPLLKKVPTQVQLLALLLVYAGIFFVMSGDTMVEDTDQLLRGSFWVFLSAFTYSLFLIGSEFLIPVFGSIRFTSWSMSLACMAVFIHTWIHGEAPLVGLPWQVYAYGATIAIFSTILPSYLVSAGIKRIGAGTAAIISSIGPVSTILLAWWFLNESLSETQLVGTAIVLAGVGLISFLRKKQ